jgi:hypothetical protein
VAVDFSGVIGLLTGADVEVIVIGGLAAQAHGSARITQDSDFLYRRTKENINRLTAALAPHDPYLRGAPAGLPFRFDTPTVERGLNFTLVTKLGDIDLLGEVSGVGGYDAVLPHATTLPVFGHQALVMDLPWLIRSKRAAGRPKDLETIAELEALLAERERADGG